MCSKEFGEWEDESEWGLNSPGGGADVSYEVRGGGG